MDEVLDSAPRRAQASVSPPPAIAPPKAAQATPRGPSFRPDDLFRESREIDLGSLDLTATSPLPFSWRPAMPGDVVVAGEGRPAAPEVPPTQRLAPAPPLPGQPIGHGHHAGPMPAVKPVWGPSGGSPAPAPSRPKDPEAVHPWPAPPSMSHAAPLPAPPEWTIASAAPVAKAMPRSAYETSERGFMTTKDAVDPIAMEAARAALAASEAEEEAAGARVTLGADSQIGVRGPAHPPQAATGASARPALPPSPSREPASGIDDSEPPEIPVSPTPLPALAAPPPVPLLPPEITESSEAEPETRDDKAEKGKKSVELPARLIVIDEEHPRSQSLTAARTTIGRDKDQDLSLNDRSVSSQHAEILFKNGQHFLRDLDSKNATRVDGKRAEAHKEIPLFNNTVIAFGSAYAIFIGDQEKKGVPKGWDVGKSPGLAKRLQAIASIPEAEFSEVLREMRRTHSKLVETLVLRGSLQPKEWLRYKTQIPEYGLGEAHESKGSARHRPPGPGLGQKILLVGLAVGMLGLGVAVLLLAAGVL